MPRTDTHRLVSTRSRPFYVHFTPSLQENIKDLYFAAYVAQGKMLVCMLRKARCKRKAANDPKPAPNHLFN